MKQLDKMKEILRNLSGKTKALLITTVSGLLILSAVLVFALHNTEYEVLYTGLNQEEAREIMAKLQEMDVPYQYSQQEKIMVPKESVDSTRGMLAVEGYPKTGFAYDVFTEHAGMMSTESEKETYKLYQLQERIGSTIRTLDGIKSAVVTINPAKNSKYVLNTEDAAKASAYVVVHMYNGGSPSKKQSEAIQRLVAKAVPDMELVDVAVLDGNGLDVSAVKDTDVDTVDGNKKQEYEGREEAKLRDNILNVLEGIYGRGNVNVSVKCTADMKKVLSEELSYTAPDTQNNSGYISHQALSSEGDGQAAAAAGIPGAQSNTNVTQYNAGGGTATGNFSSGSDTTYELNQKKVQDQSDSVVLSDVSVAVSINQKATVPGGPDKDQLIALVARSAGIPPELQNDKISILQTDFYDHTSILDNDEKDKEEPVEKEINYLPFIVGGGALALLLAIIIIVVIVIKKRKKKNAPEEPVEPIVEVIPEEKPEPVENVVAEKGSEIQNQVQSFAEENPEISAAMLRSWLRSEEGN